MYKTWYDAEMDCVNQGSHLASIHSIKENVFISYIASSNESSACDWRVQSWIGLSRNGGNFQWTDGTPFDYSSWEQPAPVSDSNRQCVKSWIGQTCYGDGWDVGAAEWMNRICDERTLNYVCKKARIP